MLSTRFSFPCDCLGFGRTLVYLVVLPFVLQVPGHLALFLLPSPFLDVLCKLQKARRVKACSLTRGRDSDTCSGEATYSAKYSGRHALDKKGEQARHKVITPP